MSEIITYIIVKKGNNMIGIIEWGRNADGAKLNDKGRENVWGEVLWVLSGVFLLAG